ncbi:hypothetical protein GCM10009616_24740 [Microlunatus lacustris]
MRRVVSPIGRTPALWHIGRMPAESAVLLPLAAGLTLLGLLIAILAGRRGRKGRMVQGIGLALLPVALYLSGLLGLVWDGVVAVGRWASSTVLSPTIWAGFALLAVCVVLWVVGGIVARRTPKRTRADRSAATTAGTGTGAKAVGGRQSGAAPQQKQAPAQDDDMAEIEALLKSRGIE